MTRNTFLAALAVIFILPLIYVMINGFDPEETHSFRGLPVRQIAAEDGLVKVPSETENAAGVPMVASFTPGYIERVTGFKPPNAKGLNLSVAAITSKATVCAKDGLPPPGATFATTVKCAENEFGKMQLPAKTNLFVSTADTLIVFGNAGDNRVRLFHNNVVASYSSPDMTQTERKTEACIAKMMISHLLSTTQVDASVCSAKPAA